MYSLNTEENILNQAKEQGLVLNRRFFATDYQKRKKLRLMKTKNQRSLKPLNLLIKIMMAKNVISPFSQNLARKEKIGVVKFQKVIILLF